MAQNKQVVKVSELSNEDLLRRVIHTIADNSLHEDPEITELLKRFRALTK